MLARYFELLVYRANAELSREASRAYLGFIWWILDPLLYMAIFYIVFGVGLRKGGSDYVMYLLCGLLVWKWIDSTIRTSCGIISSSVGLMGQVYIPKIILPAVIVVANTYKFLIVYLIFLVSLLLFHMPVTEAWLYIPVLLLIEFLLICAVSGFGAALVPIIPDAKYLVNYGMTLLFFLSGIFFDINDIAPEIQVYLRWNPMVTIIDGHRAVLLYGEAPDMTGLIWVGGASLILFVLMFFLLVKLDRFYPRVVG